MGSSAPRFRVMRAPWRCTGDPKSEGGCWRRSEVAEVFLGLLCLATDAAPLAVLPAVLHEVGTELCRCRLLVERPPRLETVTCERAVLHGGEDRAARFVLVGAVSEPAVLGQ